MIPIKVPTLILLLLGLCTFALAQDACNTTDYQAQYSQCSPSNTHDLIWYKRRNSTCTGGDPAPDPVFDLPCNITCGQGQFLPLGSLQCSACQPGTFSQGGGRVVNEWNTWPTELGVMTTYCVNNLVPNSPPINCSGWTLTGATVRSGLITHVQSSILVLQSQLLIAGSVKFSYRVDAEPNWDGLIFYVDNVVVLPLKSVTNFFVDFTANLTAGYHTLKWEYYKDRSESRGEDAAYIRSIQIAGLTYAESKCTPCEAGSISNSAAVQCTPCPLNTAAATPGSTVCTDCPDDQFAYVGLSSCSPRQPCTENDYQILYGPCSTGNTRTATASWLNPVICDTSALALPGPASVPCAACPPGTSQDASYNCNPCPKGSYSSGGSAPCQPCVAGSAAPMALNFSTFDSWPSGATTSCVGNCGTTGWRLRSGFIDSGSGHGSSVDSSFSWKITLEQPGTVTFAFALNCTRFCSLAYLDYPYDASIVWNTTSVGRNRLFTYTTPIALEIGDHTLTWTFDENPYDPTPNNRTDAAQIYSIIINGTTTGGASKCNPCLNGTSAAAGSSFCTVCPAGQSNDAAHSQCVQCQGNTFSPTNNTQCLTCGPTTTANSANTDCIDTCKFTLNGLNYDLTSLANKSYGPVSSDIYQYYINLCGRGGFIPECHDVDDVPLNTHVCQVLPYGYSLDVGWSSGYYALPPSSGSRGFRIHYDLGTMGCGPKNNGVAYPRNSDLTFVCDPSAGLGVLQNNGSSVENTPCHYSFVWRSLYACPVCTTDDYSFYYTTCNAAGKRTKIYYWTDPILCHDGVALPPSEQVGCSDSTYTCGIGQRLGSDGKSCVPCDAGEYSVGGGLLINAWPTDSLPYDYTSTCSGLCTTWSSDDGLSIHSGFANSSLVGTHSFRNSGTITFRYKLYIASDGLFSFYVDGAPQQLPVSSGQSRYDWVEYSRNIAPGAHVFEWRFANGARYSPTFNSYQGVSISSIYLKGLDFHADACLPCPGGSRSSNDTSYLGCVPCDSNTYSGTQSSTCSKCPTNQYSLPSASVCVPKVACTNDLYYPTYSACTNNTRTVSYVKLVPDTCTGGVNPPASQSVPCAPCPPYTNLQNGNCVPCPTGQLYRNGACVNNALGNIVRKTKVYFTNDSASSLPAGFITGCSGVCGSQGWRNLGGQIDSGFHQSNTIDSWVSLTQNFDFMGEVSFTYSLSTMDTTSSSGLTFMIDNIAQQWTLAQSSRAVAAANDTKNYTAVVQVPSGQHVLKWNFHQERSSGRAVLSKIILKGAQDGISGGDYVACPPGQYSSDAAASACTLCPAGSYSGQPASSGCSACSNNTYNPNPGASSCLSCGYGSYTSVNGSTQCVTNCQYTFATGETFNLNGLPNTTVFNDLRQKFLINVCQNVGGRCNSHVCIENVDGSIIDAGNSLRVVPDDANSSSNPFAIHFEHGDVCVTSQDRKERVTVIQFQCETENPSNQPDFVSADNDCRTLLNWRTLLGCRKCTESDYTVVRGVCTGGHRKMSKTRIGSCNGEALIALEDENCSSREVALPAIIVVAVVLVVVILIAVFIFYRNRRLSIQYASLMEETRSSNVTL